MYIYQADTYCDECGLVIIQDLLEQGWTEPTVTPDSEDWPVHAPDDQESDSPNHCANQGLCKDGIALYEWGLDNDAPLFGAETRVVGAILSDNLTTDGVDYLEEMLSHKPLPTPYQEALHNLWRETFAAYL